MKIVNWFRISNHIQDSCSARVCNITRPYQLSCMYSFNESSDLIAARMYLQGRTRYHLRIRVTSTRQKRQCDNPQCSRLKSTSLTLFVSGSFSALMSSHTVSMILMQSILESSKQCFIFIKNIPIYWENIFYFEDNVYCAIFIILLKVLELGL